MSEPTDNVRKRNLPEERLAALTEFLLARITEDEELAADAPAGVGFIGDMQPESFFLHFLNWAPPERALAECQAKRGIVEDVIEFQRQAWPAKSPEFGLNTASPIARLAAVYADHPDYDESWRP